MEPGNPHNPSLRNVSIPDEEAVQVAVVSLSGHHRLRIALVYLHSCVQDVVHIYSKWLFQYLVVLQGSRDSIHGFAFNVY